MAQAPIINAHTHTFTSAHVPPYLAKTFVPWPFYYLLHLRPIVALFRWWIKGPATWQHKPWFKRLVGIRTAIISFFDRIHPLSIALGYYVFLFTFFLLYHLLLPAAHADDPWINRQIEALYRFLKPIFPQVKGAGWQVLIIAIVFAFFDTIRNLLTTILKLLVKVLGKLPGPQTKEMARRYVNIGRYAFHEKQKTILSKLKDQYPEGSRFVILPMDMEYMGAGQSPVRYRDQMAELAEVKDMATNRKLLYPFVFADPRRMVEPQKERRHQAGDKIYFDWEVNAAGNVQLNDCFIRDYITTEGKGFAGIKIYPALGYYPFDEKLLPLWKYCADQGIPVLTHCIKGVIFYRGVKMQDWNTHPIFEQAMEKKPRDPSDEERDGYPNAEALEGQQATRYEALTLPQSENVAFSYNFTHPLNYLCLLEEPLLRKVIEKAYNRLQSAEESDKAHIEKLIQLFGYRDRDTALTENLSNLKICLGHFGGEDEWARYFEKDRDSFSSQLTKRPLRGIEFLKTVDGDPSPGKLEQLWKFTDWYSIICSMMLQFPCVYADISYILHGDAQILPLLTQTLAHEELKKKVLYGTDFFVVRNHKSDKNMLADMMGGLSQQDFDQIARVNPVQYLQRTPCKAK